MTDWLAQAWTLHYEHIRALHPLHAAIGLGMILLWVNLAGCWFASIVQDFRGKHWESGTLKLWGVVPVTIYFPIAALVLYACGFIEA